MILSFQDTELPYAQGLDFLVSRLDRSAGVYMASDSDYPGRYSRWDIGFDDPPVAVRGYARRTVFTALNPRGEKMLDILRALFAAHPDPAFAVEQADARNLVCTIAPPPAAFSEEERSRQPSPLSPVRHVIRHIAGAESFAGFYGAFKYDLLFCFNPIPLKHPRAADDALFTLFLPDSLYVIDHRKETVMRRDYGFAFGGAALEPLARALPEENVPQDTAPLPAAEISSNMTDADFAKTVEQAGAHIRKGDVFQVVLSRVFTAPCAAPPSQIFRNIRKVNPSPYMFLIQTGTEQLVGASPEMFVRVEGRRVETCPIAGTARRSRSAGQAAVIADSEILQDLLNSDKDKAELTMCTDVDRNDKARICVPGSVRILGRRQIESYAGLYHTVDHVEGRLRDGFDGIDAFMSHMWAVTLTGAPKPEATKIIENTETTPRGYYGAAIGVLHLNGDVNTGITIRTVHLQNGVASYRSGAGIVYDSVPALEAAETHTKATAFRRILSGETGGTGACATLRNTAGAGKTVILIDNEDSFVHTLADYLRQTGATALTYRHGTAFADLLAHNPDLIVHSPGPGLPEQFGVPDMVRQCAASGVPQFGVCLGLQGMFQAFGGALGYLATPRHGKTWSVHHQGHALFADVASPCRVGAYHSIFAEDSTCPATLDIVARNENGVVMAIAHKTLPAWAVQFHPESLLSLGDDAGFKIVENVVKHLAGRRA